MVRELTGTAAISQDWSTGSGGEHAEHNSAGAAIVDHSAHGGVTLDDVVLRANALKLAPPAMLTPPTEASNWWWAKSNAQNRPLREEVAFNPMTGDIADRSVFAEKHVVDQIISFGIAAHEGQLFAPLNQVLGVLTATGLVILCVSAFVMWRRRAPDGVLGAPPPIPDARVGLGLGIIIITAAVLLPVLGASLIVLAILERGVLARWPSARRWLGLQSK
jgi:uncharacterized iron-regulated membrane protein